MKKKINIVQISNLSKFVDIPDNGLMVDDN